MTSRDLILVAVVAGLIPAAIGAAAQPRDRWRAFVGWWVFGAVLFVVALPMALLAYSRSRNPRPS